MKLDRYDLLMANGCAKEETRPILNCVSIKEGELCAADGFVMIIREANTDNPEEKDLLALLPKEMLKSIAKHCKGANEVRSTFTNKSAHCQVFTRLGIPKEPIMEFGLMQGTFPAYKEIANMSQEKKAVTALSVSNLKKVLSAMPNSGIVRIGVGEPTQPVELECSDPESDNPRPIRAIIMPMFVTWRDFQWKRKTSR